jgi:hypothetical protein
MVLPPLQSQAAITESWSGCHYAVQARERALRGAGRHIGSRDGLVHDLADRSRTTAALRIAAKTAIDLPRSAWRIIGDHDASDIVVGQDVAVADNHGVPLLTAFSIMKLLRQSKRKSSNFKLFQTGHGGWNGSVE